MALELVSRCCICRTLLGKVTGEIAEHGFVWNGSSTGTRTRRRAQKRKTVCSGQDSDRLGEAEISPHSVLTEVLTLLVLIHW